MDQAGRMRRRLPLSRLHLPIRHGSQPRCNRAERMRHRLSRFLTDARGSKESFLITSVLCARNRPVHSSLRSACPPQQATRLIRLVVIDHRFWFAADFLTFSFFEGHIRQHHSQRWPPTKGRIQTVGQINGISTLTREGLWEGGREVKWRR